MKVISWIVGVVYRILAAAVGKDPIEYLAEISARDGVSQERFNLMLDRLNFQ